MALKYNPFQSKLAELKREQDRLEQKMLLCYEGSREDIREVKQALTAECQDDERRLEEMADSSRSEAVSEMAKVQLEHYRKAKESMEQSEAAALYAEFAVDHAIHAAKSALLAACIAMEMQMEIEEKEMQEDRE